MDSRGGNRKSVSFRETIDSQVISQEASEVMTNFSATDDHTQDCLPEKEKTDTSKVEPQTYRRHEDYMSILDMKLHGKIESNLSLKEDVNKHETLLVKFLIVVFFVLGILIFTYSIAITEQLQFLFMSSGDKTSVTRSNHPSMGSFTMNPRSIIDVCLVQEGKLFLKLRYPFYGQNYCFSYVNNSEKMGHFLLESPQMIVPLPHDDTSGNSWQILLTRLSTTRKFAQPQFELLQVNASICKYGSSKNAWRELMAQNLNCWKQL
ncbi:uncharacterized protein LOC134846467 [Symsagittifera roscoffensis]|uniref:uncharacterized protein LOC134846467 n=1 Tax=Symsagittifera roscoffensis TaxID=84072 RepID=UPI00307B8691